MDRARVKFKPLLFVAGLTDVGGAETVNMNKGFTFRRIPHTQGGLMAFKTTKQTAQLFLGHSKHHSNYNKSV